MNGEKPAPMKFSIVLPLLFYLGLTVCLLTVFFRYVDLKPQVEEAFFFSSDDPQLKADKVISSMFPQPPQFVIAVKGNIYTPKYTDQITNFSDELAALPEVFGIQSLTRGPEDLDDAYESPLWKRVLTSQDGKSTFVSVFIREESVETVVPKIEKIAARYDRADFRVMISGAPYIVELIRRELFRDLQVFMLASIIVFAFVLFIIFRSVAISLGTLLACIDASCVTLILTRFLHIPMGPLTANLSTMVFVLTLSPAVFLTFNWKHLIREGGAKNFRTIWATIKMTILPSFWSMATTLAGFLSLLFVQATPMRQLGVAGAIGTFIAFASAYTIYPWFLLWAGEDERKTNSEGMAPSALQSFFSRRHGLLALALLAFTAFAYWGLAKVNTDPDLISYFKKGGELRNGLEYIDQNGGSSPLKLVLTDQEQGLFSSGSAYLKMWKLNEELEKDPAVGNVISLPIILAEAKRSALSFVLSNKWLLKLMDSPKYGEIAKYFVTKDRSKTLFLLRMREQGSKTSRLKVIQRIEKIVKDEGFNPVLVGGVYALQGKLSELLSSSLVSGVLLLLAMFVVMGWGLSRSFKISTALLICLSVIPICVLGITGHLKVPLDIISAPAVNLAIGMGVDAMIYLSVFARRASQEGQGSWEAWSGVVSRLWQPIGTSLAVICSGFGIFLLSIFPPTQRFGFSVILGSLISALVALFLFPWLSTLSIKRKKA